MSRNFLIAFFGLGLVFPPHADFHAHLGQLLCWIGAVMCLFTTEFLVRSQYRRTLDVCAQMLVKASLGGLFEQSTPGVDVPMEKSEPVNAEA